VSGSLVYQRVETAVSPGYHQWAWDGRDLGGKQVAYGTYLFRVASSQGGDKKVAEQGKLVRAPEKKTTAATATTP